MSYIYLDHVGHTPLIELKKINPYKHVRILVKVEYLNPSLSIKDRIVKHIVAEAEKSGELQSGGTIVENTSGNTGAAVAMIAAIKGYKAILTMPDKVSIEKQNALKAYGAQIVVKPTSAPIDSPDNYIETAKRIAREIPNSFRIDQYNNPKNSEAHYVTTGPEIWKQTEGKIDYFVASGSTGGTISGTSKFLKERNPKLRSVLLDPIGSIYYDYIKTGTFDPKTTCSYLVEGVGEDHLVKAMDFSLIDEVFKFTDQDAFLTGRKLAEEEGLFAGGSSGANVWGALKLASTLDHEATIVTVLPDSGVKYLSKMYNDDWMREKKLL